MMIRFRKTSCLSQILVLTILLSACIQRNETLTFDGDNAFDFAIHQVAMGPRVPGTPAHAEAVGWISSTLTSFGWGVEIQDEESLGKPVKNIIAKRGNGKPWIVLGAHYDSRMLADQETTPEGAASPVPGANDGASGAAILMEIGRTFPSNIDGTLWLVFFDAEDNGNIEGWDWIMGSNVFVESLKSKPDYAVVVDMVGDKDLNIYMEHNSEQELSQQLWGIAEQLGFGQFFIPTLKYQMLDDHLPFLQADIPAVLIIDFDYPYWHTLDDTVDKISPESLQVVGETLQTWLFDQFSISIP